MTDAHTHLLSVVTYQPFCQCRTFDIRIIIKMKNHYIIALPTSPLKHIDALLNVPFVMKAGVIYKR